MKTDSLGVRMPNMLFKWQCTLHKINSLLHVIPRHWPRGRQTCVLPSILTHRALEEPQGVPVRKMHSSSKVSSSRSYPSASDCSQPSLTSVTAARGRIPWTRPSETRQKIETGKRRWHTGILHHFKAGMQIQLWRKNSAFLQSWLLAFPCSSLSQGGRNHWAPQSQATWKHRMAWRAYPLGSLLGMGGTHVHVLYLSHNSLNEQNAFVGQIRPQRPKTIS